MKKKWILLPSLLALAVIGAVAALPALQHVWEEHRPWKKVVVDRAMRAQTIDSLVAKLNEHYVFPDKARQMEALLRRREQAGSYDGITDGNRLAGRIRADLQTVARDLHLKVWFEPRLVLPGETDEASPASQAQWEQRTNFVTRLLMRQTAARQVKKVGRLGPDIGYLEISGFPPAFHVGERYGAAMDELADTAGLIVDLRQNGGGEPESVALLVSYFVDKRTRLNDIWARDTGITTQQWTQDKLDGNRYGASKPVLILVGPGTMSAGEDFAYTMQALKRATVIGERTWGGAHPARPHRLGEHFYAVIPGWRTISPITGTNWEGVGVTPDIAATPDKALAVARNLMRRRLDATAPLVAAGP